MQEKTLAHAAHPKMAAPSRKLADLYCDSLGYEFGVNVDKFNLQSFSKLFESRFKEPFENPGLHSRQYSQLEIPRFLIITFTLIGGSRRAK